MSLSRRRFIKTLGTSVFAVPFAPMLLNAVSLNSTESPLSVNIFSKHLQFLDLKAASQISAELGFSGLDLTVRPKGHILPEHAKIDLISAIADIKKQGSNCEMITTAISDVNNPFDIDIIKTAAKADVRFYRSNWFKYHKDKSMEASINVYQQKIKELGEINQKYGIVGCYQNHAGTNIGSSYWEIKQLLETVNPDYFGTQYDIRHAMVEGGLSWKNGLKLLKTHIKTIVVKDYKWENVNGRYKVKNVPIGEGMVDFTSYFKLLKSYGLNPPVSLHLEYPLGGAEKGRYEIDVDKKVVFDAMKKDLAKVQQLWRDA
jgi:sugar phosphate isomerase/epimerase